MYMKKIITSLVVVFSISVFATENFDVPEVTSEIGNKETAENVSLNVERYKLYPTKNMWNFIKLDTRTGVITQVQYDINGDGQGEWILNYRILLPLHESWKDAKNGRFRLYPTQNTYNFLLLDQVDGRMWQVQWSTEAKNRGIVYDYQLENR